MISSSSPSSSTGATVVCAKYAYVGRERDELSFEKGDEIDILGLNDSRRKMFLLDPGWEVGQLRKDPSRIGLCPMNYVVTLGGAADAVQKQQQQQQQQQQQIPSAIKLVRKSGKVGGYATDIIVVKSIETGELFGTSFIVRFGGASMRSMHEGDGILLYVDDRPIKNVEMVLGKEGVAKFSRSSSLRCDQLHEFVKEKGTYTVRFEHVCAETEEPLRYIEASIFVWNSDEFCIVSDVDGTITKSDLGGMFNTTLRIKVGLSHTGYAHEGVCVLFQHLVQHTKCHMIYLTARPLDLIDTTRTYIHTLTQNGKSLPPGPIITDRTNYYGSIRREVIDKTSHEFKSELLLEVQDCFTRAKHGEIPAILAGFGNKYTDAMAYEKAGIPKVTTFIVNPNSEIKASAGYGASINSYSDPQLALWIESMIDLILSGKISCSNT